MPGPAVIFREIHRLRRHAKDLQEQIERGPQAVNAHETKVARQEQMLRQAQEGIKKLKMSVHEKELTLKTKQQQIAKHEKQLNEATSKKEYDALQAEIAADKRASQKLEDDILEGMEQTEVQTAQVPEVERAVQRLKEQTAQLLDDIQTRRNQLMEQLNAVHKNLQEVEASLPEDVRVQYQRLVNARGEDAMSAVSGRTCIACYTEITAQHANNLLQGHFVPCRSCGRILYLPE